MYFFCYIEIIDFIFEQGCDMVEQLKPPYVKKIEDRNSLHIWAVNGAYIRGHMDEEFTNFGQHYRYKYIPENEFWIDLGTKSDEWRFFIDHLLVEHRLMEKGAPYSKALEKGDLEERKERRRSRDLSQITHHGQNLPEGKDVHIRLWKKLKSGVSVWVVNGRLVRSVFDIDFTAGGHDYVYEFVPENEVWIDDDIEEAERGFVLFHELHERNRMADGWNYDKAHSESSRLEYHLRHYPDELHDALYTEGWA
jgi:hypothetical protein